MDMKTAAGLAGLAVFLVIVIIYYNRLVRLRLAAAQAWSDIDVHLKKRYELLPNLVDAVKAYAGHEQAALTRVVSQRAAAMSATAPAARGREEGRLGQTLQGLVAVAEAYPDLKADGRFQDLMKQMRGLEDNIEYARRYYNCAVRDYNTAIEAFPSTIVAAAFAFMAQEFFELDDPELERRQVGVQL
jgi:LemA protein